MKFWLLAPVFFFLTCVATIAAGQAAEHPSLSAIDQAFKRLYNCDFAGANAVLDDETLTHPDDPLIHAVRGAAYLLIELDRLKILELDFFESDAKVTDRKRLKPNPAARDQLFKATAEARRLAKARLAVDPNDSNAMFALCMAVGTEMDYGGLVEKKYFQTYSLSKESQQYARKLLAMNPPVCDAYLTLGTLEYVVANLNFIFRLFVHIDQIEGSRQKAIENLKKVADGGRYYPPFAKILMSAIYMRENQVQKALALMTELEREFPENSLLKREIERASAKLGQAPKGSKKQ